MEESPFSAYLPSNVDFEECANNIIPINDENYRSVIDWFKACLLLSQNLPVANRDGYELKVIENVKKSLSNFFQRTELSLSTLIGLEREVSAMFRGLGPPVAVKSKQSGSSFNDPDDDDCESPCDPCDSGDDEMGDALSQLHKRFLWVAITSVILLILLVIVLATMCWLKKYIERDIKEIFVACPSKEGLQRSGSLNSKRKHTVESKKMSLSPGPDGIPELPHYEDEIYLEDYGNQDPAYAYPVKVWKSPLTRKRQPGKPSKCFMKKSGL